MLDSNTSKVTWVAVAIGIVALLGMGSLALFPDAFNNVKVSMSSLADDFAGPKTEEKAVNLKYSYDTVNKTASVVGLADDTPIDNLKIPASTEKDGVTYAVTSIGDYALSGSELTGHVTIPDSVITIGEVAFQGSVGLTGVTLGNHVKSIGDMAFSDIPMSDDLVIPDSVETVGMMAFGMSNVWNLPKAAERVTLGKGLKNVSSGAFSMYAKSLYVPEGIPFSTDWLYNGGFNEVSIPSGLPAFDWSNIYALGENNTQNADGTVTTVTVRS